MHGSFAAVFDIPATVERTPHGRRTRLDLEGLATLCGFLSVYSPVFVTEHVAGRRGDNPFSIGELTRAAGTVEGALASVGIMAAVRVPPAQWKRDLGLLRIPKNARKAASLELARLLFPECAGLERAKDHNRAEALLIGHWARLHAPDGLIVADRPRAKPRRKKKRDNTKNVFC